MNVFDLDRAMIDEYAAFTRSFTKIRAQDIRDQIDAAYGTRRYWPEPIVQINPHYKRDKSVATLVAQGVPNDSCNVVFRDWDLRMHQVQAIISPATRRASSSLPARDPESPSASSFRSLTPSCAREISIPASGPEPSSSTR